jgi:3-oxoacyl-[acyl-carrier protein] reductase
MTQPSLHGAETATGAERVAIVTGGARGIGAAIAERLTADGLRVAIVDRELAGPAATDEPTAAYRADVADEHAVAATVARIAEELGPPVVLVNNAGIAAAAPIAELPTEQWDAVLGVNLRGTFLMTRAVAPFMSAAKWGRIVNVASISALGDDGRAAYAASKAGLLGFTKSLALELGPSGITANVVAPGFVVSDMTARSARRLGRSFEDHQRQVAAEIPVGRVGLPADIANAASFFAGDPAGFVSGQVLYVAGGPVG